MFCYDAFSDYSSSAARSPGSNSDCRCLEGGSSSGCRGVEAADASPSDPEGVVGAWAAWDDGTAAGDTNEVVSQRTHRPHWARVMVGGSSSIP